MIDSYDNFKQIDDIIDARKKLGQYNVCKQSATGGINYRYAYSSTTTPTTTPISDKFTRSEDAAMISEGDYFNTSDIKPSDSEITIVRVRCDGLLYKRRPSKWDMHDIAIPGDGSHLGESPSMVNLATLVQQNDEYLVPLSSWDPYNNTVNNITSSKNEETINNAAENRANVYLCDDIKVHELSNEAINNSCSTTTSQFSENSTDSEAKNSNIRRSSLAGRISKFLRRHCKKPKTLPEAYQPSNDKLPAVNQKK